MHRLCGENKLVVFKEGKVSSTTEQGGHVGVGRQKRVEPGAGQQARG